MDHKHCSFVIGILLADIYLDFDFEFDFDYLEFQFHFHYFDLQGLLSHLEFL